jgi:hypothetical protein
VFFHKPNYLIYHAYGVGGIAGHHGDPDCQRPVNILRTHFSDGGVEPLAGFVNNAAADLTLIFKRCRLRYKEG